ncbi:RNA methyltransferase [Deinococcus irradiatisoli]|uniref:tRNA (cytidine/uridine-2'-O-)-methyltransferase TrmJ n=1 Tax=Deinococcus irradiatisoli TaxID=2202254 RepID=A0A2Z3JBE2_9DEIO|nr:RNA methyltransferase [Deinococcus irradiatisoli]AWN22467.1 RNA methyltransferase [Deinococcus irradiatisoli]
MNLAVVLVSPKTSGNVGAAARAMLNMGASDLRIVAPRCDYKDSASRAMAVHAAPLLESAKLFGTLKEAIADCDLVVGTSARTRAELAPPQHPAQVRPLVQAASSAALVFGPEESGLSNADLELCRVTMLVPTAAYASLNLAQAVLLSCYEFLQSESGAGSAGRSEEPRFPERKLALSSEMEGLYGHLHDVMMLTGYTDAVRARHTMRLWRVALDRAAFSPAEVRLVRGLLRQVQWKIQNEQAKNEPATRPAPQPGPSD